MDYRFRARPRDSQDAFMMKFGNQESSQLAPMINGLRRWSHWHDSNISQLSGSKSVVENMVRMFQWWRIHVGAPFPLGKQTFSRMGICPPVSRRQREASLVSGCLLQARGCSIRLPGSHSTICLLANAYLDHVPANKHANLSVHSCRLVHSFEALASEAECEQRKGAGLPLTGQVLG